MESLSAVGFLVFMVIIVLALAWPLAIWMAVARLGKIERALWALRDAVARLSERATTQGPSNTEIREEQQPRVVNSAFGR